MSFNYDKLKDAIHYIIARNTEHDGTLDDVKLNKILWYADALVYMSRGQPITGTTYIRKPRGPVAKYQPKALQQLIDEDCVVEGKRSEESGRWRPILDSIKEPNVKTFSASDREILDAVYDYINTAVTTQQISDQSHGEVWMLARDGEELPLYTMFAEITMEPTAEEIREASRGFAA